LASDTDNEYMMTDATIARAHQHKDGDQAIARTEWVFLDLAQWKSNVGSPSDGDNF
jgi:hypothetical protein